MPSLHRPLTYYLLCYFFLSVQKRDIYIEREKERERERERERSTCGKFVCCFRERITRSYTKERRAESQGVFKVPMHVRVDRALEFVKGFSRMGTRWPIQRWSIPVHVGKHSTRRYGIW